MAGVDDMRRGASFIVACVLEPRSALERARSVGFSHVDLWMLVALASIVRVLESALLSGPVIPLPFGDRTVLAAPLTFFVILSGGAALAVFVLHYTARMLGGSGDFAGSILTIALTEWVVVVLVGIQVVIFFTVPILLGLVTTLALIVIAMTLLNFININHGFNSMLKALLTVVLGVVGASFGAALIITLIGGASTFQT